ncbi:carboxypeptidase-like protein A4 precursor [Lizonia empirigonia]|nr:carboxypeptidase-like protein A4 precursor [Lizonia empirigonia]
MRFTKVVLLAPLAADITPSSAIEAHNLANRFSRYHTHHFRDTLSVVIPPDEVLSFESLGLNARLVNSNMGAHIRNIDSKATSYNRALNKRGELPDLSWFDGYHPYADHLDYWDNLMHAFPENSKKIAIGKSYENRTMHAILWHATVHSRGMSFSHDTPTPCLPLTWWISTMVIEYLAHQLIAGYKTGNADVIAFLDHFDFYLVPFTNPDGFVYSQTTDRMWRKTRQPRPSLNTTSMLATQGKGIRSYIDFHSYNEQILTPWGYTCDTRPTTIDRMLEVGNGIARAIGAESERNSTYVAAPGCEILYVSTGCSRDHHYAVYGANHSWSLELSPQDDRGSAGFVLDPKKIGPVVRELWAGQLWMLREVWDD